MTVKAQVDDKLTMDRLGMVDPARQLGPLGDQDGDDMWFGHC